MNEHIKNAWGRIKEYKKEVVITGAISVGLAISGILLYKKFDWQPPELNVSDTDILGNLVRHHDGAIEVSLYDEVPLAAMGKLGRYLTKNIPDLPNKPNAIFVELVIAE